MLILLIFCLCNADVTEDGDDMNCMLCRTYQAIIGDTCSDEIAAPDTCGLCGRTLSTTKTGSSIMTNSGTQCLMQSFDLTSLPADEYSLVHSLWELWGQDPHQSDSNQEQSVAPPPQQQVVSLSGTQRCKRMRSFGTKQIGF